MMPGTGVERASKQVTGSVSARVGNGPGGRRLGRGELVALSVEQTARLGELFERFGDQLVRYACSKLLARGLSFGAAGALAEDMAQNAWVRVARSGANDLLSEEPLSDDQARMMLFARVKSEISAYFRLSCASEIAVDWRDHQTCATLCPLLPSGCAAAVLPPHLARMVAALPDQERTALLLKLDGMPERRIAEHLGVEATSVRRLTAAALLLLQIDNPELSAPAVAVESLPAWERDALARLSTAQREMALRLEEEPRRALLLLHAGRTSQQAAEQLETAREKVLTAWQCLPALRAAADPEPPAPVRVARYREFAQTLRAELARMQPGEQVPGHRELVERFGVTRAIAEKAVALLRREGLITSTQGLGMFVTRAVADLAVAA